MGTTRPVERGRILRRAEQLLRARREEIARIETIDTGRGLSETLYDADGVADALEFFGGVIQGYNGESIQLGEAFSYCRVALKSEMRRVERRFLPLNVRFGYRRIVPFPGSPCNPVNRGKQAGLLHVGTEQGNPRSPQAMRISDTTRDKLGRSRRK